MTLGERLKQLRLDCGWTQAEMAARFGVDSAATISHYETGLRGITVDTLVAYADAFGMSVQALIAPVDFGERVRESEPIPFEE